MVIIGLMGGLGNQMFQYALGRRLAYAYQTPLKLDVSFFAQQSQRTYRLGYYAIQEQFATVEEVGRLTGTSRGFARRLTWRLLQRTKPYYGRSVIVERHYLHFDPNILRAPKDVYLVGYWQNARYFADIQDILRAEFTVKGESDSKNREMAKMIQSTVSVGLHVRRGDYVSDPQINAVHGTCGLGYYEQCVRLLAERCPHPHFFVFSDDPQWAKDNLNLSYPMTIVSHNGTERDYADLYLMSLCQHFILANSTFSWWAVWLSTHSKKLVFAPKRWFATDDFDTRDFIPEDWLRV